MSSVMGGIPTRSFGGYHPQTGLLHQPFIVNSSFGANATGFGAGAQYQHQQQHQHQLQHQLQHQQPLMISPPAMSGLSGGLGMGPSGGLGMGPSGLGMGPSGGLGMGLSGLSIPAVMQSQPFAMNQGPLFGNDKKGPPNSNLFVYNLPDQAEEQDLFQMFSQFGNVISCMVY